MKQQDFFSLFV